LEAKKERRKEEMHPLVIPPAVMLMAKKLKAVQASRPLSLVIAVTTIPCCMGLGLPCALAIFPLQMSMDISKLEPECDMI
jgi:hypothetical protein